MIFTKWLGTSVEENSMDCWTRETEESDLNDKESQSLNGSTLSGPLVDTRGDIAVQMPLIGRILPILDQ